MRDKSKVYFENVMNMYLRNTIYENINIKDFEQYNLK